MERIAFNIIVHTFEGKAGGNVALRGASKDMLLTVLITKVRYIIELLGDCFDENLKFNLASRGDVRIRLRIKARNERRFDYLKTSC